jgi:hypothetical protein
MNIWKRQKSCVIMHLGGKNKAKERGNSTVAC